LRDKSGFVHRGKLFKMFPTGLRTHHLIQDASATSTIVPLFKRHFCNAVTSGLKERTPLSMLILPEGLSKSIGQSGGLRRFQLKCCSAIGF
jgi:hypothetical protein